MRVLTLYGLMVCVPVAVVGVALVSGQTLRAPPSLSGTWTARMTDGVFARGCQTAPTTEEPIAFTIAQSGRYLTLTLRDSSGTHFSGQIRRARPDSLVIEAREAVAGDRVVSLRAQLDTALAPALIRGRLRLDECSFDGGWTFVAVRGSTRPPVR